MEFDLQGNESFLTTALPLMLNVQLMLKNQSIGYFVGQPLDEYVSSRPQSTKLYITLYSRKGPPFKEEPGKRFVRATYGVPNVDKNKIDWLRIKKAVGGDNGFMWGEFTCTLKTSTRRQIRVYGESKKVCQEIANNLANLSVDKINSEHITENPNSGSKAGNKKRNRIPTRIYPAYFYVMNQEKIESEKLGYPTKDGNYARRRSELIPLWIPKEPRDFREKIRDAFYIPGVSR